MNKLLKQVHKQHVVDISALRAIASFSLAFAQIARRSPPVTRGRESGSRSESTWGMMSSCRGCIVYQVCFTSGQTQQAVILTFRVPPTSMTSRAFLRRHVRDSGEIIARLTWRSGNSDNNLIGAEIITGPSTERCWIRERSREWNRIEAKSTRIPRTATHDLFITRLDYASLKFTLARARARSGEVYNHLRCNSASFYKSRRCRKIQRRRIKSPSWLRDSVMRLLHQREA